jgi:hypothetical protein
MTQRGGALGPRQRLAQQELALVRGSSALRRDRAWPRRCASAALVECVQPVSMSSGRSQSSRNHRAASLRRHDAARASSIVFGIAWTGPTTDESAVDEPVAMAMVGKANSAAVRRPGACLQQTFSQTVDAAACSLPRDWTCRHHHGGRARRLRGPVCDARRASSGFVNSSVRC